MFFDADNGIVRMQGCTLLQLCINYVKKVNEKTLIANGGKSRIMNYASIIMLLVALGMFIYGMPDHGARFGECRGQQDEVSIGSADEK